MCYFFLSFNPLEGIIYIHICIYINVSYQFRKFRSNIMYFCSFAKKSKMIKRSLQNEWEWKNGRSTTIQRRRKKNRISNSEKSNKLAPVPFDQCSGNGRMAETMMPSSSSSPPSPSSPSWRRWFWWLLLQHLQCSNFSFVQSPFTDLLQWIMWVF